MRSCRDGLKVHVNVHECVNSPTEWIIPPTIIHLGTAVGSHSATGSSAPRRLSSDAAQRTVGFFSFLSSDGN